MNLISYKREQFHIEIRRRMLESTFQQKRKVETNKQYPIEQLIDIVNRLINLEEVEDNDFRIVNLILDEAQRVAINEPEKFIEWEEHLSLIGTLVNSMGLAMNPNYQIIATKAAGCLQSLVEQKKPRVYMDEHLDQVCEIYKSWIASDQPLLNENGIKGLNQICTLQAPKIMKCDFVEQILKCIQTNRNNEKAFEILSKITKNIDDDNQVITILRLASKLVENIDKKIKKKGLLILENASRNLQNIQFILTMRVMQSILDLASHKDEIIQKLAMSILVNLSYTQNLDDCIKLFDLGIIDVVYKLLKNNLFTYYRKYGSIIFNNLMASSYQVLDRIIDNNKLIDIVFTLLDHDVVDVRKELYQSFKNFLLQCNIDQLLKIIDAGLLDYEIQGLQDYDSQIIKITLETLWIIMSKLQTSNYAQDISEYCYQKKVPQILEKLQHHESKEIYEFAQVFIKDFFEPDFYDFQE